MVRGRAGTGLGVGLRSGHVDNELETVIPGKPQTWVGFPPSLEARKGQEWDLFPSCLVSFPHTGFLLSPSKITMPWAWPCPRKCRGLTSRKPVRMSCVCDVMS